MVTFKPREIDITRGNGGDDYLCYPKLLANNHVKPSIIYCHWCFHNIFVCVQSISIVSFTFHSPQYNMFHGMPSFCPSLSTLERTRPDRRLYYQLGDHDTARGAIQVSPGMRNRLTYFRITNCICSLLRLA